jgi:uncharacterized DUF497 family protein
VNYRFEWDPAKARRNQRKHGVSFERAATVFKDPKQLSIYDRDHSDDEDRWVTLGMDSTGNLLVVVHTYRSIDNDEAGIRLISARTATMRERRQYNEGI